MSNLNHLFESGDMDMVSLQEAKVLVITKDSERGMVLAAVRDLFSSYGSNVHKTLIYCGHADINGDWVLESSENSSVFFKFDDLLDCMDLSNRDYVHRLKKNTIYLNCCWGFMWKEKWKAAISFHMKYRNTNSDYSPCLTYDHGNEVYNTDTIIQLKHQQMIQVPASKMVYLLNYSVEI
jgi:hypothetical protein